jgi:hypothetical protein
LYDFDDVVLERIVVVLPSASQVLCQCLSDELSTILGVLIATRIDVLDSQPHSEIPVVTAPNHDNRIETVCLIVSNHILPFLLREVDVFFVRCPLIVPVGVYVLSLDPFRLKLVVNLFPINGHICSPSHS